jgi:hypothetical protein
MISRLDWNKIQNELISEIKLSLAQAKVFLLVVKEGKMDHKTMAQKLGISADQALLTAQQLVELGGFIEISENVFEAMHPRFTAVNMYRKMCEKNKIEFKRNQVVDNIGIALENPYDDARTK